MSTADLSAIKIYENTLTIKRYGKGKEYFTLQTNLGEVSLSILLKHFLTLNHVYILHIQK